MACVDSHHDDAFAIDAGKDATAVTADWPRDEEAFRQLRAKFLLY